MQLDWYFDFVSPFSYLHWQKIKALPQAADIRLLPIVFGAVLSERGIRGPAELPGKRTFIYRQAQWQAEREGIRLRFPPAHPFNPLAALRLCVAAGTRPEAIDALFDWIWRDGYAGDSVQALAPVAARLGIDDPEGACAEPAVKAQLRTNTAVALAANVFGVPTLAIDGELFWGNESHGLAEAVLADPGYLQREPMARLLDLPVGVVRRT